jgi:hypothetical protein
MDTDVHSVRNENYKSLPNGLWKYYGESNHFSTGVFLPSMIAVTGASGLLGGNLVRQLLAKGQHVRALVHEDQRALSGLDLERVSVDLSDPASLERAFAGVHVV